MDIFESPDNEIYFALFLCTQGSCEMVVNDRLCCLKAGDAIIKSPLIQIKVKHKSEDFNIVTIFKDEIDVLAPIAEVNIDVVQEFLQQNKFYLTCTPKEQEDFLYRKSLIDGYKEELLTLSQSSKQHTVVQNIIALLEQTTILEYARIFLRQQDFETVKNEKERSIMIKFVFYLFQNYKNHREVSFYADALNFSPNHFTRIIKKASGRTPSQWIALVTINQAKKMLRYNNTTIKDVSIELNFPEQFTFRKYFKLYTGISPKEYKKMNT